MAYCASRTALPRLRCLSPAITSSIVAQNSRLHAASFAASSADSGGIFGGLICWTDAAFAARPRDVVGMGVALGMGHSVPGLDRAGVFHHPRSAAFVVA